jgi:FAD-linked sulfhydryl oxidase
LLPAHQKAVVDLPIEVINLLITALLFEMADPEVTRIEVQNASPLRVSREELGRFTWTFLHSMAAAYPENPTEEDKKHLNNLLNAL